MTGTHGEPNQQVVGLVRTEVAKRLGVGVGVVRRLEWDRLHPVADCRGVWRFDPAEVEAVAASMPAPRPPTTRAVDPDRSTARRGRLAARIFRMFGRGLSLPQIVVMTKQPPEVIRALHHEWNTTLDDAEWARTEP